MATKKTDKPAATATQTGSDTLSTAAGNTLKEAYQQNFATLTQATQALTDGAASVFQRQHELLQRALIDTVAQTNGQVASLPPPQCPDAVNRFKTALETGLTNNRAMIDLATKAHSDAFDIAQRHMSERLEQRGKSLQDFLALQNRSK